MKTILIYFLGFSFVLLVAVNAQAQETNPASEKKNPNVSTNLEAASSSQVKPPPTTKEPIIFQPFEVMPRFTGCEGQFEKQKDLEKCAKEKLIEYVYKHLEHLESAKEEGIQGLVIVQFHIDKDGSILEPKIVRNMVEDSDGRYAKAALNVIKKMQSEKKWIPGFQRGKKVKVQYTLPIKFGD